MPYMYNIKSEEMDFHRYCQIIFDICKGDFMGEKVVLYMPYMLCGIYIYMVCILYIIHLYILYISIFYIGYIC